MKWVFKYLTWPGAGQLLNQRWEHRLRKWPSQPWKSEQGFSEEEIFDSGLETGKSFTKKVLNKRKGKGKKDVILSGQSTKHI